MSENLEVMDTEVEVDAADAPTPEAPEMDAREAFENALDEWDVSGAEDPAVDAEAEDTDPEPEVEGKAEKPTPEAKGEEAPEDSEDQPQRVFSVRDADGKEVAVSDSATWTFKADGQEHSLTTEQVVEAAQKGVYFDRRNREVAQKEQALETERQTFQQRETEYRSELEQAEAVLRQVLTDPDFFEKTREIMEQYDDPNAKQAREAQTELQKLKAERERLEAQQREQAGEQFWGRVQDDVTQALEDYDYLVSEDIPAVVQQFYAGYQQAAEQIYAELTAKGLDHEAASDRAQREALPYLSEENLKATMERLDSYYGKRVTKRGGQPTSEGRDDDADIRAHNEKTERKLQQNKTRTLRTGGSPNPSPSSVKMPDSVGSKDELFDNIDRMFGSV